MNLEIKNRLESEKIHWQKGKPPLLSNLNLSPHNLKVTLDNGNDLHLPVPVSHGRQQPRAVVRARVARAAQPLHLHGLLLHDVPRLHHHVRGGDAAAAHLLGRRHHGHVDHLLHMQGHGHRSVSRK